MMSRTRGATLWALAGAAVSVEVDCGRGLPCFQIVGQPDRVIQESRDRIRAAFRHSGLDFPSSRVSVNLAPSELPKTGSSLDLAIAVGIAAAAGHVPIEAAAEPLLIGELGFDGSLRPVRGTLALASQDRWSGADGPTRGRAPTSYVVVASQAGPEAALCPDLEVRTASSLKEVVQHLRGEDQLARATAPASAARGKEGLDLHDILGHESAKRALEIAAAGSHHMLLVGPPGSGKTLLAARLPELLPDLCDAHALEVARLHSLASSEPIRSVVRQPPLRTPHHTISEAGFVGGGRPIRPGELSLAHRGVLFLDELPEFRRNVLEALRQPLESGTVHLARAQASHALPASVQLIAAMNPCPCGYAGDPARPCECDPAARRRYRSRLSGPLLDRIDLHLHVPRVPSSQQLPRGGSSSEQVRKRVARARQLADEAHACASQPIADARDATRESLRTSGARTQMEKVQLEGELRMRLGPSDRAWLNSALERLGLSLRASGRILRVAHTIALLDLREILRRDDLAEALGYRWLDRTAGQLD